ncbi:hypothetical protein [Streptomyces sp. NPDC059122]|uniref:hypothetical protein n=1 Tax=Streptomyces sp. NPDC059122 TaxID=3346732 RepID=UPI0036BD9B13
MSPTQQPTPASPVLALPPAFEAFYALQYPSYLAFAGAHFPLAEATAFTSTVFGALITRWDTLVGSFNPTADAWDCLSLRLRHHAPLLPILSQSPLHYDVLVLTALGYTAAATAAVTGREPSKIRYLTHSTTARSLGSLPDEAAPPSWSRSRHHLPPRIRSRLRPEPSHVHHGADQTSPV